jgi:hypothetical protein
MRYVIIRSKIVFVALLLGATASVPVTIVAQPATDTPQNGMVSFAASSANEIVRLHTRLVVPTSPAAAGTLFVWPGLQPAPRSANFMPIDNGVLQSVLSWGPSCAPGQQPDVYSTWWISGQYVNTIGHYSGYTGCFGGPIMAVDAGDTLDIDLSIFKSVWTETIVDLQKKQTVSFHIDLANQAQAIAWFDIESYDGASPRADVIFLETTISFAFPNVNNCDIQPRGANDKISAPIIVDDGQSCYIEKIVLSSKVNTRPAASRPRGRGR